MAAGKSRKHTLGSFFKRATDDPGSRSSRSERASSKGKRKTSHESKGSRDSLDKSVSLYDVAITMLAYVPCIEWTHNQ